MKKYLGFILILALCVSLLSVGAWAAGETAPTAEDTISINSAEDLKNFRDAVNSGNNFEGKTVVLGDNIDLEGSEDNQWTPIGNGDAAFAGTFNGNGHTISGLYYNSNGNYYHQGLFGYTTSTSVIENLAVSGYVFGGYNVGGIVGTNYGTIKNCVNSADVRGSTSGVGGIVGLCMGGQITNCYNTGDITCQILSSVGGIVGEFYGNTINNCYNAGTITWTGGSNPNSVVGTVRNTNVSNCYYLEGTGSGGTGCTALTAADMGIAESYAGWDFEKTWRMDALLGRPVLRDVTEPEPETYEIRTAAQLVALSNEVNSNRNSFSGKTFELMDDVDLSGDDITFAPIGTSTAPFSGTFEGNGHNIELDINLPDTSYVGLFGYTYDAILNNFSLSGSVKGNENVGSAVGYLGGESVWGSYGGRISNVFNEARVSGSNYVGGIVGEWHTYDSDSKYLVNVGKVDARDNNNKGGIVGYFSGSLQGFEYYLDTCIDGGNGRGNVITENDLVSGRIAYELQMHQTTQQYWGQTLGTDGKPVLTDESNRRVLKICFRYIIPDGAYEKYTEINRYINPGSRVTAPDDSVVTEVEGQVFVGWYGDDGKEFDKNTIFNDSASFEATYRYQTPASGVGYTIVYGAETAEPDSGYELSLDGTDWGTGAVDVTPGGTLYVRRAGSGETLTSEATKNTLPARPAKPVVTGSAEVITGADETMEYSTDGGTDWVKFTAETAAHMEPGTYEVRVAATDSSFASDSVEVTVVPAAPDSGEGYEIDFEDGAVSADEGYEVSADGESFGPGPITVEPGGTIYVREQPNGEVTTVNIPARPGAPAVTGGEERIIGATDAMEYSIDGASWVRFTESTLSHIEPGTYYVRLAATGNAFASERVEVTVSEQNINIPDTYEIELIVSEGGEAKTSLSNASAGTTITVTAVPDEGYVLSYITVDGERISGTSFKMPAHDVTVRVYFTDGTAAFADVSRGDWFYEYVDYVAANGLMEGVSDTAFEPDANMTRVMVRAVLARMDGEEISGANWAEAAREWAMESGVSDGTDPSAEITREQLAAMLHRFAGEPATAANLAAFTDAAQVSAWAVDAMSWCVEQGIITGVTDTALSPQGTATRAQCAAMLMRFELR